VKYRLPERLTGLGPLNGNQWSFTLVPDWRDLLAAPLEEICAHQYVASNEAVLSAREAGDEARWVDVTYEDLVARPDGELQQLYAALELPFTQDAAAFATALPDNVSATALTDPGSEKWQALHPGEIERILPFVAATEERLGY
jgi:hypothetical protein